MDWVIKRFRENWPKRKHKGDHGRLLMVGGSRSYPNTPAIVGTAASRTGVDIPHILAPERAADASATHALDLIASPLDGDVLDKENAEDVIEAAEQADAMVIGNGIGREQETLEAVEMILDDTSVPVVIDADALHADLKDVDLSDRPSILTPHAGEFEQLYEEVGGKLGLKKEQVQKASRVYQSTVVLTGPTDVISNGSEQTVNKTGAPVMTKGGTGDMLAGIVGTLLCTYKPFVAAAIGTRAAGEAGEHAAEDHGQAAGITDMLDHIEDTVIHNEDASSSSTDR